MNPSVVHEGGGWAFYLVEAHKATVGLHESFTLDELKTTFLLAPRGLVITMLGDPSNVSKDLPPTVDTDVIQAGPLSPMSARGVRHVVAGIRRLADWRHFLGILEGAHDQVRTKLLTYSGHDNVSALLAVTPHANNVSVEVARVTIKRHTGAPVLERKQLGPIAACPVCNTRGNAPESLEQHAVRCPTGGARAFMHA